MSTRTLELSFGGEILFWRKQGDSKIKAPTRNNRMIFEVWYNEKDTIKINSFKWKQTEIIGYKPNKFVGMKVVGKLEEFLPHPDKMIRTLEDIKELERKATIFIKVIPQNVVGTQIQQA